jgi:hypothetical protein
MTSASGARRLGVDGENMVPGLDQPRKYRRGKYRRTHVDEIEYLSWGLCGHRSITANAALRSRENSAALRFGELAQDHPTLDER